MVLRQHGSAWCLSGPLKRLAYSRKDLSLLQRQSTSQENSEPPDIFQHQSTGYLRTRGQETLYETSFTLIYSCIIIPLYETLHDLPFSVTSEASETQNHLTFSYWVPKHQGTGYFMRSECIKLVLVSFTLISHIVSCMLH